MVMCGSRLSNVPIGAINEVEVHNLFCNLSTAASVSKYFEICLFYVSQRPSFRNWTNITCPTMLYSTNGTPLCTLCRVFCRASSRAPLTIVTISFMTKRFTEDFIFVWSHHNSCYSDYQLYNNGLLRRLFVRTGSRFAWLQFALVV